MAQNLCFVAHEVILVAQAFNFGVVGLGSGQGLCFVTRGVAFGRTELPVKANHTLNFFRMGMVPRADSFKGRETGSNFGDAGPAGASPEAKKKVKLA